MDDQIHTEALHRAGPASMVPLALVDELVGRMAEARASHIVFKEGVRGSALEIALNFRQGLASDRGWECCVVFDHHHDSQRLGPLRCSCLKA